MGAMFYCLLKKNMCVAQEPTAHCMCGCVGAGVSLYVYGARSRLSKECIAHVHIEQQIVFWAGLSVSVSHDVSCGETTRLVWNSPLVCVCVWRSSFCLAFRQTSISCTSTPQYNTRHSHALLALATGTQSLRLVLSLATHSSRTLVASTRFSTRHSLALLTKHPDRSLVTSTSTLQ